jgi:hypothetical protein
MFSRRLQRVLIIVALLANANPVGASALFTHGPNFSIGFSPDSGAQVGQDVNIHIKVDSSNPGATKINVGCGGVSKTETSEVEFDSAWHTSGCDAGYVSIKVCARDVDDPNWQDANCVDYGYNLSSALDTGNGGNPPATVTAQFWADSENITFGSCTNLHWETSGANQVDVDGTYVNGSDSITVCPSVTTKYSLKAVGDSGEKTRNVTIVVSASSNNQATTNIASYFRNRDLIEGQGGKLYIFLNGTKRWIPSPQTLDDLGLGRGLINNRGFSKSEIDSISNGPDIPDSTADPLGFANFKSQYFSDTSPIISGEQSPTSQVEPIPPTGLFDPHAEGVCSGWETRLWIGAYARITGQGDQLKLRAGPSLSEAVYTKMPAGYKFTVIDGPVCADAHTWWKIQGDVGAGWGAEQGDENGKSYWWMAPMTEPPSEESVDPIPTVEMLISPTTEEALTTEVTPSSEPPVDSNTSERAWQVLETAANIYEISASAVVAAAGPCAQIPEPRMKGACILMTTADMATQAVVELLVGLTQGLFEN